MDGAPSGLGLAAIERCADAWAELHARIAHRFARAEARERAGRYLAGLLERVERKNGWQLAEAIGEAGPRGVQRLLSAATWDADGVRDDLRDYVVDHLGDEASGVLIVDETGFLKKGKKSCGVARQYTGTAGDHRQLPGRRLPGLRLAAMAPPSSTAPCTCRRNGRRTGHAGPRRASPRRPAFATKIELAQRMLARAFDADVPARWVVADAFYGRSHALRRWLEERGRAYALMIPKTNAVRYQGRRERAEQLGERLCPDPALGPWACLELSEACAAGMRRWLLVRCDAEDPDEHALLPRLRPGRDGGGGVGPRVRDALADRGGLRAGEGRGRPGPVRGAQVGGLAPPCHPLPAGPRLPGRHAPGRAAGRTRGKGGADPGLIPLTVPEVRRLVLAMGEAAEQRPFRLGWSRWRRAHQAVAARCHAARRALRRATPPPARAAPPPAAAEAGLTDAEWHRVAPLLPPQKPTTGRPRHDHRTVLAGILWVVRSGASWRAMPTEYGKWETAYKRYRLWCATGLWQRILAALAPARKQVSL